MPVIALAAKVPIGCCLSIVGTIIEHIEVVQENDKLCERICRYAGMLKGILEQLQGRDDIPPSSGIDSALQNLQIGLERCKSYVASLDKRALARQLHYLRAKGVHCTLQGLQDELHGAVGMMNAAVGSCSIVLQLDQRRESQRLRQHIQYPSAGEYFYSYEENSPSSPYAEVVADDDTQEFYLVIGWKSSKKSDLTSYEVQYDETNERSVYVDSDRTGVKIGKPKVYPGVFYRIRVREIYSSGVGKWSTSIPILMSSGPPNLHPELQIKTTSTTKATITVQRPTPEQENGSPITSLVVETHSPPDLQSTFKEKEFKVEPGSEQLIEKEIELEENTTTTLFQVKFKNAAGSSPLSNVVKLTPTDLVPGPPTFPKPTKDKKANDYMYIKRRNDCIQFKWQPPSVNPAAVKGYQIDMRTKRKDWEPLLFRPSDKQSAVVAGLESNTKYWFRVFAVNHRGTMSSCSAELQTETKYGPKAHRAAKVFATIGGFLGGPIGGLVVAATLPVTLSVGFSTYDYNYSGHKTAAAVGGAVEGAVIGVVAAPFMIALSPLVCPFVGAPMAYYIASALDPDEITDD